MPLNYYGRRNPNNRASTTTRRETRRTDRTPATATGRPTARRSSRQNRNEQRPRSNSDGRRRMSNPSEKGNANNELKDMMKTLMTRMDRMEELISTKRQEPETETNKSQRKQIRFQDTNADDDKSTNPQFTDLWKSIYKGVQLKHHLKNWKETPKSIKNNLEELAEQINPPVPSEATKKMIHDIMMQTGERVKSVVQEHLQEKLLVNQLFLATLDPTDHYKARAIAEKHLKRRLGNRIQEAQLTKYIDEEMIHIDRPRTRAPEDRQPSTSAYQWTEVVNRTAKRKQPDTRSPPGLATRSRFEVLTSEDVEPTTAESDYDEEEDTEPQHTTTKPSPKTQKKDPAPNRPVAQPTNIMDEIMDVSTITQPAPRSEIRQRRNFDATIKTPPGTDTLVITDSQMRNLPGSLIPTDWFLSINPGMKIDDGIRQIGRELNSPQVKTIILSVGINDRTSTPYYIKRDILELARTTKHAERKGISVLINEVAYNRRSLPDEEQQIVDQINQNLTEYIAKENLLHTLPTDEVKTKPDGIHLTDDCMGKAWFQLVQSVKNHPQKNPPSQGQ